MAGTIDSLHQTHHSNPSFQPLLHFLDPISLILSQNRIIERGPRSSAYAELRENMLRMKFEQLQEWEETEIKQSPVKKQVEFNSNSGVTVKRSSVLMQSVPDFPSTLLKENRKPSVTGWIESTPPRTSKNWSRAKQQETEFKQTPTKKQVKFSSNSGVSSIRPSVLAQSVPDFSATLWKENRKPEAMGRIEMKPPSRGKNWSNSGEKKGRLVMARKSYASVDELKAINGGSRGLKSSARLF
ncbi:uncharacterized protein LOC120139197 [Hibiscus syriacus]|uniref:uncharacterized protein LOC120139197 n=1 Tax=Hibiscus syriacus TaxID=106335 RepID=UPI001921E9DA|nr:uncharacterized protein LOC120139197 [Hibiscus syriacus]